MDVYRFGAASAIDTKKLYSVADHFARVSKFIPMTTGVDLTTLSEAQFLAAITGRSSVSGFGASHTALAFRAPTIDLGGLLGINGVGSLKTVLQKAGNAVKDAVKKVGDTIKEAFQKLTNWIFKGIIQKAAPYFLYAFVKDAPNAKIQKKKDRQLKVIDFIANATGSKRETVMTAIAAAITNQKGKSPAQLLNDVAGKTIAGANGEAIIKTAATAAGAAIGIPPGVTDVVIDIIKKIIALFKKKDSEAPELDAAPDASDFDLPTTNSGDISTPTTTVPSPTNESTRVAVPTPIQADELAPTDTNMPSESEVNALKLPVPKPKAAADSKDNSTVLFIGAAALAAIVLSQNNKVGYTTSQFGPGIKSKCANKRWSTSGGRGSCSNNGGVLSFMSKYH